MSVEAFLALNLLSDAALIGAASRALGVFSLRRVALASALGAAYGTLATIYPDPWASPAVQVMMLTGIAALLSFGASARLTDTAALMLCTVALLAGGISRLIPLRGSAAAIPCAIAGGLSMSLLYAARPPRSADYRVRIRLNVNGKTARFDALVDTGNRLREPLSGLPVLVAEEALVRSVLPDDGYRELRFGAIGGDGILRCFKPTSVWIERGRHFRRVPDLWVAVSKAPLPGCHRALAPCAFVDYIK